jgi:hypothetical protein
MRTSFAVGGGVGDVFCESSMDGAHGAGSPRAAAGSARVGGAGGSAVHANEAAAEDQQTAWDVRHGRRLAACPDAVELTQVRHGRHDRVGAVRDDHVVGGVSERSS